MISNVTVTTGTAANIYASSGNSVISTIYLCNTSGADILLNMWAVPSGGVIDNGNQVYRNLLIAVDDTYVMDRERLILGPNDSLRANSNIATSVAAIVSHTGA